jgi:hypothetical protein
MELRQREQCAGNRRVRRVVAAHGVQRDARQASAFPCSDPLFPGVEPALLTHTMRALHAPALGTLLHDDRGRRLMRVTRALLPLARPSLRNSHGEIELGKRYRSTGFAANVSQRVPAAIDFGFTRTRPAIEIGAAPRAQTFAILAAERERWRTQQPLLANGWPQIYLRRSCRQCEDIGIFGFGVIRLGEEEVHVLAHWRRERGKTSTAGALHRPFDAPVPVVPT